MHAAMQVTLEVFGVVRDLLGGPAVTVELPASSTARHALAAVAARHPTMVGPVLEPGGHAPQEYYLLNLNGRRFLKGEELDEPLPEDAQLLLITAIAGGSDELPERCACEVER